ncbi:MAG: cell division protein FtsZ [Ignavibacteria bacterium]|nr:cell division protein FtsZ [Ignavibacteria bacterium]
MPIKLAEKKHSGARIKVIGIGGGGGNILNSMVDKGIKGVEFIAVNTDIQALDNNKAEVKLQIGKGLTKGLGTGMDDEIAAKAVDENRTEIEQLLEGSDMVFVTAGMGGGTGTGGAPVVARIAKNVGALVVAIITKPFRFEGKQRIELAEKGIERLRSEVDSLIIVPNENILKYGSDLTKKKAFELADKVLHNATNGISKIITEHGEINVDFADVRTIMKDMGEAMIGTGIATGEARAEKCARQALVNPVLDEVCIKGSKSVLTNIVHDGNIMMSEIDTINSIIREEVGEDAKYIFGLVEDPGMGEEIMVTVIATGFSKAGAEQFPEYDFADDFEKSGPVKNAFQNQRGRITEIPTVDKLGAFDIPSYKRREVKLSDDLSETKKKIIHPTDEDLRVDDFVIDDEFSKPAFLRKQAD